MGTHFVRRGLTVTLNRVHMYYARALRGKLQERKPQSGMKSADKVSLIFGHVSLQFSFLKGAL